MYLFGMALDAPFTVQKIWDFHPFIIPTAIRTLIGGVLTAFLLQSWIPPILLLWNPPGWSLSTEACFYALFPMIVLFLLRRSSKALVAILIGAWALSLPTIYFLTTAIPALNTAPPLFDVHGNFRLILGGFPLVRLPEFVIGVCLGSLYLRHGINVHESIIIRAIPASALAVFVLIAAFSGPLYLAITATPLFAALIFSAAMQREGIFTKFLSTPVLLLLGESSYCLYIIHWPIAKWFNVLVGDVSHDFALYFLVVTALSIACFKLIERPMCRSLRSFDKVPKESSKIDH
jgi:peptidoglycan/LPS O-acetylase OafA/YrhL